ncbi:unnamed protein product, partial [Heterosigma akashiwo]
VPDRGPVHPGRPGAGARRRRHCARRPRRREGSGRREEGRREEAAGGRRRRRRSVWRQRGGGGGGPSCCQGCPREGTSGRQEKEGESQARGADADCRRDQALGSGHRPERSGGGDQEDPEGWAELGRGYQAGAGGLRHQEADHVLRGGGREGVRRRCDGAH